jgi:hypothetical protein
VSPLFTKIRVLEKRDVIVSTRGRNRVPHLAECIFLIFRVEQDLEDALFVRQPMSLVISRCVRMQREHRYGVSSRHD